MTPETGSEVWVRAFIHVDPPRHGNIRVVITDAKASHHSIDLHSDDVVVITESVRHEP